LVASNEEGIVDKQEVKDPLEKSGHFMITFKLHCPSPFSNYCNETCIYQKANYELLREMLREDREGKF